MANNAKMIDVNALIAAGIDPKTGLPIKFSSANSCALKENIRHVLRIIDEQNALQRFTWYNCPKGIDGNLIERILYYRGNGAFFYMKEADQFFFLPFALDGSIDVYGRFTGITPLPFNGKAQADEKKESPWITGLIKKPLYEVQNVLDFYDENGKLNEEKLQDIVNDGCVLIRDYSQQLSQTNTARQMLNEPILDVMSDCVPFMRTALLNSTGVQGLRVGEEDEAGQVIDMSTSVNLAALTGQKYVPTVAKLDFQELTSGSVAQAGEFLQAMQSLDNFRLSTYGLDNGGLFQKNSHLLQAEQELNGGAVGLILADSLYQRQRACDIINSIWGLGMMCEPNETVLGIDRNGDMMIGDNQDQSGQPKPQAETEVNNDD